MTLNSIEDKYICMTVAQEARWKAELEIIQKLGKIPSSREMQQILKKEYGISVNHNIVNTDLKRDLEALTKPEYENQKSGILDMLNKEITIAHNIATTETDSELQLKAMNTVSKLSKVKSEILIKFRKAHSSLSSKEKPLYNIHIGHPVMIDPEKFKKLNEDEKKDDDS